MQYEKKYINSEGDYEIYEIYQNGIIRKISENQDLYQKWLLEGNSPTEIPYVPPPQPPEETLEQAKEIKISEIDSKSIMLLKNGFVYSSKTFNIINDEERWKELLLAATAGLITYPINVYAKDKTSISLADITEVTAFIGTFMNTREGVLQPGRVLKEQVVLCTTKTEVDAIIDNR